MDIAAFDHYDHGHVHPPQPHHCAASNFSAEFLQDVHMVVNFAEAHGKVPAIAEFGVKTGCDKTLDADWWTKCFLDPMAEDPMASKDAYLCDDAGEQSRGQLNEPARICSDEGRLHVPELCREVRHEQPHAATPRMERRVSWREDGRSVCIYTNNNQLVPHQCSLASTRT